MPVKAPIRFGMVLITVLLGVVTGLFAQEITIKGYVTNEDGEPITDAQVVLNSGEHFDITNGQGFFEIEGLTGGTYLLKITHLSYQPFTDQVTVSVDLPNTFEFTLELQNYRTSSLIVTATRTLRKAKDVPLPVTVISKEEITRTGSTRLSDILQEQTGLVLIADHGTGVQMQGLSAAYTKIMINGQPLIGRTAGTLNLDRISVGNVKRIEIIKGPSSALWGSDALAGVINVITEMGNKPFDLELTSRIAENETWDLGLNLTTNISGWQNHIFVGRKSSKGYSLVPNSISQTVPSYRNYTASYRTSVPVSGTVAFKFNSRFYSSEQDRKSYLGSRQNPTFLDINAAKEIYSLSPAVKIDFSESLKTEITNYFSRFRTDTKYRYARGDSLYNHSNFDQYYNKTEIEINQSWNKKNGTTTGGGYVFEQLEAERYSSIPTFSSYFIFAQHQWMPTEKWDIIFGARYDRHSAYGGQLSPKLSASYRFTDWLQIHASAGSGFKAPAFRQLYLNFTNPTVGYSVFGSKNVIERIKKLQKNGIIDQILIPLNQLDDIQAEQSWAFNAGVNLYLANSLELQINTFYNDVNNLIETAPVATKQNGQSVFSYFNLNEVYTSGIELQLQWYPTEQVKISGGYQFLNAKRKHEETRKVQNEAGEVITKTFSSYKPLFNRSRHTANIKIYYSLPRYDISANIRGFWRSKYGRIDANGNGFVNEGEYADGYMLWNAAVAKTFSDDYTLRLGINNVFNFTRPGALPFLPGQVFYVQVSLNF